ncbi:MAG: AAA domain-containing protein [Holophagales bacterium]|nr:AAA domain-containing protein [Holophagales bacterium]MYD22192.1 AAA domain-containing protein [Holophagales bacterium]MYI33549.1 AAA domain-containing protein [Holophagales bacterium]
MTLTAPDHRATELAAAFVELRTALGRVLVGQDDAATGLTLALLAEQHAYLEGPPGCGKSELAAALAALSGARTHTLVFHRDIRETDLLGDVLLSRHRHRGHERLRRELIPGPLLQAEIALLEDLPRSPGEALGPLLRILAERHALGQPLPLESAVATGPLEQVEAPIDPLEPGQLDRFAVQLRLTGLLTGGLFDEAAVLLERGAAQEPSRAAVRSTAGSAHPPAVMSTATRKAAQRAAAALQVEPRTLDAYHRLLDRLRQRTADESASGDRLMSDRSFSSAALRLVRAHAFLRGAPAAAPRDLGAIRYMVAHRLPEEVQEDFDHILEELLGDPPNVTMAETGAQMPGAQSQGDDSDGAAAASPASDSWIDDQADLPAPPTLFGKPPPPAQVDPLLRALVGRIERGRIDPDTDPGGQPRGYRPLRDLDELIDADLIEALLFADGRLPGAPRTFERKRKSAGGAVAVLRDISASMAGRLTVWSSQVVLGILRVAARRRMRVGYVEFHHRALPHHVGGRLLHRSYSRLAEQAGQAKAVGQTNYEAPLRTALEGLRGGSGRNRHVVLLTDGLPIIGDTTVRRERQLARRLGVALHTVFLGNGDCPPVLDDISLETGGLRFYGRPLAGGGLRLEER